MSVSPEEGLRLVDGEAIDLDEDPREPLSEDAAALETLRDEFVDAFNARDLDSIVTLAHRDVECPDIHGDGIEALSEEISAIWERSPSVLLTRAFLEGEPCAVGWLPDEEGCWSRAALVCFASDDGLLSVVSVPDDADALDRAEVDDPVGEEQEEGTDWVEWDRGEASEPRDRGRERP
ncbi:MAG TPA: hypothetical protein VM307_09355 [Egibacteraceae bacterium]|nr:hypothetical protein [Egibacteraceae bacterium]